MTNSAQIRRYIFLDFETLKRIKFKKLEKICDKVFLFVSSDVDSVPLVLVRDMQKMGNAVKWIEVSTASDSDLNYNMCFLMGKLHEKISPEVEFAILSNDAAFDPLVNFINSTGRSCLRVRQSAAMAEATAPVEIPKSELKPELPEDFSAKLFGERMSETASAGLAAHATDQKLINETAQETVRRLIRSGNRPYTLATLRSYILLHNQELSQHGDVEKIIERLENNQDILVQNGDVQYNF